MTTITEAYEGLANGPLANTGLRAYPYVPGSTLWPAAYILPPVITYESLAGKVLELHFDVVVLVSAAKDKNQQGLLDYMNDEGAKSIPLAVHSNPSLGLDGVDTKIIRARPLNLTEQAGYGAFGALFECSCRLS